ncbi:MAG: PAS domain S-box protein [Pseudomonadota bacterium]|nr:PAS domain S-box protein [Pseudomonadota bacterium]
MIWSTHAVLLAAGLFALLVLWAAVRARSSGKARVRADEKAEYARRQYSDILHQKELLDTVLNSQARSMFVTDRSDHVVYANRALCTRIGKPRGDVVGKPLATVFGKDRGQVYQQRNHETLAAGAPMVILERKDGTVPLISQVQHIPIPGSERGTSMILVTEEDITGLVLEREKRETALQGIVEVMMDLADLRDPNAARHSARAGNLARALARELGLDPVLQETAERAGELMNIGKLLVPREILTKPGSLTPEEKELVRQSLHRAAGMLKGIDFDGPVADTLLQSQEHYGGGGWPDGWKGDDILITARIIAVANAFVALVSPRAHRPQQGVDQAMVMLMEESGKRFDPRVLQALQTYLDTGGRGEWSSPLP